MTHETNDEALSSLKAENKISVGIGQLEVGESPHILETFSLGSCVGIAFYDSRAKIGGLAHIMLPDSKQGHNPTNPEKFADTAILLTLKEMERRGTKRNLITAKIAGGASMFFAAVQDPAMAVGARNVEAVKINLKTAGISIIAEDTGGTWGRTMEFRLNTGIVFIKSALKETKQI